MLKTIINFLNQLNPDIIVQAPSRINLINPLDAVEGDFWMPSVAINGIENPLSVFFYIKKIEDTSTLKIYKIRKNIKEYKIELTLKEEFINDLSEMERKFSGKSGLIYSSIYRLCKTYSILGKRFKNQKFELGLLTTIPRQSGLGGSAAIIISILYAFSHYFNIYNNLRYIKENEFPINKDTIAELATKIEDEDLKVTAGYGDRYVISRGGLCFCSYYGKLLHKKISKEPLAVYDRIDITYNITSLPIIICFSGVTHESGSVHDKLRTIYLQEDPNILKNYSELAKISWKSRFALMRKDWKLLGEYFKKNTEIMNLVMKDAGFEYGIGRANNILIKLIEDHPDVYAAKLTGAGGGGSVFALVNPNKIHTVLLDWKKNLNDLIKNKGKLNKKDLNIPLEMRSQLLNAEFYKIKISNNGVSIIEKN
ncbi:MAG: hypothetical protein EU535_03250 [Promethearchaeota archaeon]|nr:MAG: hypothetical protein EU535_03250 [Candidatus Lokiarchaeota archaeon]